MNRSAGEQTLHSLTPTPMVRVLEFNSDRTIGIHRLFARPCDRFKAARADLKLGGKIDFAHVPPGKEKGGLPQTTGVGMAGIESSTQNDFLVRALEL